MEIPRFVAPLVVALGAVALVIAAVDRFQLHFGYQWPLLTAAALAFGLASGILWERRTTTGLAGEISELKQQAERQREELEQARKLSSTLQSEAALALRDSEALYHSLVDHLPLSVLLTVAEVLGPGHLLLELVSWHRELHSARGEKREAEQTLHDP